MSSFLSGVSFDKVMGAIEQEGKPITGVGGRKIFEKPAFVTGVGTSLMKCANLKRGTLEQLCVIETVQIKRRLK